MTFRLEDFRAPMVSAESGLWSEPPPPPTRCPYPRFIKGPLPLHWTMRAGALEGKALLVGLLLWYESGLQRGARRFPFNISRAARKHGVARSSLSRGLTALERAGLVQVDRAAGRKSLVHILDVEEDRP